MISLIKNSVTDVIGNVATKLYGMSVESIQEFLD